MSADYKIDRCPKCGKNYIFGEVCGRWVTWYMYIAEYPSMLPVIKIQILYCPMCAHELPSASAELEKK